MRCYRICNSKHGMDISGTGAALFPGRWNKKGNPVLYTGANPEIALLETLVHLPQSLAPNLQLLTIEFPGRSMTSLNIEDLPDNWHHHPAPTVLSDIGQQWIKEGKTLALKVPSCIIHSASNIILNCRHPKFGEVKVVESLPFPVDRRLLG